MWRNSEDKQYNEEKELSKTGRQQTEINFSFKILQFNVGWKALRREGVPQVRGAG